MKKLRNSISLLIATGILIGVSSNANAYRSMVSSCPDTSSCTSCHRDNICDGYTTSCTDMDGDGFAIDGGSCGEIDFNDADASAYPGAMEICTDGIDNDGNGLTDAEDPAAVNCEITTLCTDLDQDGYYAEGDACGTLADFNDNDARAYPGASENCSDGVDNDGNGLVDAADPNAVNCAVACTDLDGDGYSADGGECGPVDCNDENADINPGAQEVCSDGIDNNCNAVVDNADANAVGCPVSCTDADGDGYSVEGGTCGAIDCDDANASINPAAAEICDDGMDNNCNNLADAADRYCRGTGEDDDDDEKPWSKKRDRGQKTGHTRNSRGHGDRDDYKDDEKDDDD